jgi:hypothetical protein
VRPDLSETDRAIVLRFLDPTHGPRHLLQFLFSSVRESFEDLSQVVKQADLLVTHPATFAGPAVAKVTEMPWVSTVLSPLSFPSMNDPPVMPQMPSLDLRRMPRLLSRSIIGLGKRSVYRWEICGQRSQSVWHIKIGRRRQKRVRGDRPGNRRPPAVSLQQVPMILLAILPN